MPTTVNGVGTTYYFNRNTRYYEGECDSCGYYGQLSDYETTLFFVIIYIPIIPLGQKQIISDCPSCRRHRVMPLHEWKATSDQAIAEGLHALEHGVQDPDKALELLGTMNFFNRVEEARELALATKESFKHDIETQLALAGYFESEGMHQQVDECINQAIAIDPNHPGSLRAQGFDLMEAGQFPKALEMLNSLRHPSEHYELGLFMRLAMKMAEFGQHQMAIQEYQLLLSNHPELAKDSSFRTEVTKSERAINAAESILPARGWFDWLTG